MFTHKSLAEACRNLSLNPQIRGKNFYTQCYPAGVFGKPFDLSTINFPKNEKKEVLAIGTLINNLHSQIKFPQIYNFGTGEHERDRKIETFLPKAIEAQHYWLEKGLQKIKLKSREFVLDNGVVYEVDPNYQKAMAEFNKMMEEVRRESILMQHRSELSARKIKLS